VTVVDGTQLKITSFKTANVPPPMSMFELAVGSSIIDVAISSDNSLLAVLHHQGIEVFNWQVQNKRSLPPAAFASIKFEGLAQRLQLAWSKNYTIHILQSDTGHSVTDYDLDLPSRRFQCRNSRNVTGGSVFVQSENHLYAGLQDRRGNVTTLSKDDADMPETRFPTQMPWANLIAKDDEQLAIGLSRNGHLYANSRLLTKACSSYLVTPEHIILTTKNHLLKFIHVASAKSLDLPPDDPEKDERCRSIERGAKLVTAIPSNMSVILQMPRGNLETIFPRAMVIAGIRRLIDEKDYAQAFKHCRTQRVDMNILCDHKPEQFLANVELFLRQLKDVTYVDLFLSSLKEEDVTRTMYRDTRPGNSAPVNPDTAQPVVSKPAGQAGKVNTICDAVLKVLQQREDSMQNIVTAHVCKNPPALDDGLLVVARLMEADESLAEQAVEHICFLADANRLYEHALGLYNLELTLLVAQQAQMDPREYVPFIQELHKLPKLRREFTIDDHLGHHAKALGYLAALKSFDEAKDYTVKHDLYQDAFRHFRYDKQQLSILTGLFANFLESKSRFRDAGLAYESLGDFVKATSCYQSAGPNSWRECLFAAQSQEPPLSAPVFVQLATTLADAVYEAKDYAAAATIHAEYLSSLESAIRCLCKGSLFADALRLVAKSRRPDLLAALDASLGDALSSTTEFLAECKAQLKAQVPRIHELRRRAIEDPLGFYEGERPGGHEDLPDDISVAASSRLSTSASLFTRYTGSQGTVATGASRWSARNRRREEKKRARGRKGTVYEEEYLVSSVQRLVQRIDETRSEVERLVFALARRDMGERARAVEGLFMEVLESCKAAIQEIWPPEATQVTSGAKQETEAEGEMGNDEQSEARSTPPIVNDFARLSLLG
jgi:elongator complex protein 1